MKSKASKSSLRGEQSKKGGLRWEQKEPFSLVFPAISSTTDQSAKPPNRLEIADVPVDEYQYALALRTKKAAPK